MSLHPILSSIKTHWILSIGVIIILLTYTFFNYLESDKTIVIQQATTFTFSRGKELQIDINGDNIPDFKCLSKPAGNRSVPLIIPIGTNNKISKSTSILSKGKFVGKDTDFSDRFNFNDLGSGKNALLKNKYLGVVFKVKNCTHFGWIQFSSNSNGSHSSNTPIYYQKVSLTIHKTGFHQKCNKPAIIE